MESNAYTAVYVRRSVSDKDKGNNSLSIESQKSDCIKSLAEGEDYKVYCDDGKSAKNEKDRPAYMQMTADAKSGLIKRILVKRYDRFSRDLRDYLNITDEFYRYGVTVTSLTESFNTETKEGRIMRDMVIRFAQFERETIAARVADAYGTRSLETGFYQGGKVYYGYEPQRRTVNGKTGSVLVPSDKAEVIKTAYEVYKNPGVSLADIINHFRGRGISVSNTGKNMDRSHFSRLLASPLYVKADIEVYRYLASKGYEIIDAPEAFDGVHGLFRHRRADGTQYVKVGYHDGLVDSETWLAVQDKKSHNQKIRGNAGAKNSWLVGLTKCGHCGYAFNITYGWNAAHTVQWRYYIDSGFYRANGCVKKRLKVRPDAVEQEVLTAMRQRILSLEIAKRESPARDTETEGLKADIARVEGEIGKLLEILAQADDVMLGYIQSRVKTLHAQKTETEERLRVKARKHKEIDTAPLSDPMERWNTLTTQEKHDLAAAMIDVVYVSDENGLDIRFSI